MTVSEIQDVTQKCFIRHNNSSHNVAVLVDVGALCIPVVAVVQVFKEVMSLQTSGVGHGF